MSHIHVLAFASCAKICDRIGKRKTQKRALLSLFHEQRDSEQLPVTMRCSVYAGLFLACLAYTAQVAAPGGTRSSTLGALARAREGAARAALAPLAAWTCGAPS